MLYRFIGAADPRAKVILYDYIRGENARANESGTWLWINFGNITAALQVLYYRYGRKYDAAVAVYVNFSAARFYALRVDEAYSVSDDIVSFIKTGAKAQGSKPKSIILYYILHQDLFVVRYYIII